MSVTVSWFLKGRIAYSPGSLMIEDLHNRYELLLALIDSEGQPPMIHTLIDHTDRYTVEELQAQPKKLKYYSSFGDEEVRQKLHNHPMLGWIISIATPGIALKMAGTVASQQRNYRWHSVATIEEALDFLQERDDTLPDLGALLDNID